MTSRGLAAALPWVLAWCLFPAYADQAAGKRDPFQPGARTADAPHTPGRGAIKGWVADGVRRQLLTIDGQGRWTLHDEIQDGVQGGWPIDTVTEQKDDEW